MFDSATTQSTTGAQPNHIWVQPREIRDAAFRVLFSAGADPAEAHEGSLAVVRAEFDGHDSLELLLQLLDADWTAQQKPAQVISDTWQHGTLKELVGAPRNALRCALQMLDLASSSASGEICAVRIRNASIPMHLWNDLVIRRADLIQRPIIVVTYPANAEPVVLSGAENHTLIEGMGANSHLLYAEVSEGLLDEHSGADTTLVIMLPAVSPLDPSATQVPAQPLNVREENWNTIYRMSRKYLVPDS
ncbi:hypothetical protein [Cryobacterium sp. PH31-O1]|uniref:hypothetical protein n=1 Tax=Cryobacterium sp. PH31-O1 TaxID=3046306 RepID=UPI0024BBA1BB|nr:hypothetical protein [Cryobacterium sp. PH31-O1]MDJ0336702.1 hypothetical protein [Cryobacterium sp. PH31-O1]